MVSTFYPKVKKITHVDSGEAVFEDIVFDKKAIEQECVLVDLAKEQVFVNEIEPLAIINEALEDYSNVDLRNETINLCNFLGVQSKEDSFSQRLINLLNADVTTPICEALNLDVKLAFQGFGNKDKSVSLQNVFDNFINMVSIDNNE